MADDSKREEGEGEGKAAAAAAAAQGSEVAAAPVQMPVWRQPSPMADLLEFWPRFFPLRVYNTLTRTKVPFVPRNSGEVTWYYCGPTVYDSAHLGHARTYVSLDVVRRIMKDYCGWNVRTCMNITDIDDKIIVRAQERGENFRDVAAAFEAEFFRDMRSLGVELPDMVTRVSEYVPEVLSFIDDLVTRGYAYQSNGSVYFSVSNYVRQGHEYPKLLPELRGNQELLAEGEGSLSAGADDKQNREDFALWKASKEGEPSWESPWGPGRPGWHIECSVMACAAFESGKLDIHAGGIDLRFPHHDNEIAQSEAHLEDHQWANYWMHTGHLHIEGLKMSKSLKNFTTIAEALKTHTARQLRFLCLMHKYNAPMDLSDNTMGPAVSTERIFAEFFHNVKASLRAHKLEEPHHLGEAERQLQAQVEAAKSAVHNALMDDFDTPAAIQHLLALVRDVNRYMATGNEVHAVLSSAAQVVHKFLRIFGLVPEPLLRYGGTAEAAAASGAAMGTAGGSAAAESGEGAAGVEEVLAPFLDVLTNFRETVRNAARQGDAAAVLTACDALRNGILPELGVRMEDKGSGANARSIWKLEDPQTLRMEREQAAREAEEKERQRADNAAKAAERDAQAAVPPEEFFQRMTTDDGRPMYTQIDAETGIPTHDADGTELPKGQKNKLKRKLNAHRKSHEKFLQRNAA